MGVMRRRVQMISGAASFLPKNFRSTSSIRSSISRCQNALEKQAGNPHAYWASSLLFTAQNDLLSERFLNIGNQFLIIRRGHARIRGDHIAFAVDQIFIEIPLRRGAGGFHQFRMQRIDLLAGD
jgi:hypothetical protein